MGKTCDEQRTGTAQTLPAIIHTTLTHAGGVPGVGAFGKYCSAASIEVDKLL
jgi:hypothetical protein